MAGAKIHETRRILAQNVKRLREARKMSQEALGNAAGLAQADVSAIEAAKHSTGVDVLQRVAKALGTTAAVLLQKEP
jgi:transcriptional regulator with XRE-family HTH domain